MGNLKNQGHNGQRISGRINAESFRHAARLRSIGKLTRIVNSCTIVVVALIGVGINNRVLADDTSQLISERTLSPKETRNDLDSSLDVLFSQNPAQELIAKNAIISPQLLYQLQGHSGTIKSLAFSPDSQLLVSGGGNNDGTIRLWNPSKGKKQGEINRAHRSGVNAVLVSPNGKILASGSSDTTLNLWDLNTNRFSRTFVNHTGTILALAVTPNSKMLVSAAMDGIRAWDLVQQRPLGPLVEFNHFLHALVVSPDGNFVATGDAKGTVKLWNLQTGKAVLQISAHQETITGIAFTPDGKNLLTTSRDREIKLWQLSSGENIKTFKGHDDWVNAIAVHPQGEIFASAGRDGIKIWHINSAELITTLYDHKDWVSAIAFSPNGKYMASGGFDQMVLIWELNSNTEPEKE